MFGVCVCRWEHQGKLLGGGEVWGGGTNGEDISDRENSVRKGAEVKSGMMTVENGGQLCVGGGKWEMVSRGKWMQRSAQSVLSMALQT